MAAYNIYGAVSCLTTLNPPDNAIFILAGEGSLHFALRWGNPSCQSELCLAELFEMFESSNVTGEEDDRTPNHFVHVYSHHYHQMPLFTHDLVLLMFTLQ